jgi:nucleotide sugar dehydrogenase
VRRPGGHFEILSNPEFLAAGTAIHDLLHPDRVIIGSAKTEAGKAAAERLAGVYAGWVDRARIITTNIWSSELAKLVANSMLAQRLSSINSISAICEATGAEVNEVSASIGMDSRVGDKFLRAGIGFGGSCFKKDVLSLVYLAESLGLKEVGAYWRQVVIMNEYQRNRFTSRVIKCLNNTLVGKKITLLGYAFKKDTSDTREAPALEIIKILLDENPGEIAIFDPCCNPYVIESEIRQLHGYGPPALRDDGGAVSVYSNVYEACASSNAILIVTDFDEFRNTELVPVPRSSYLPPGHLPLSQDLHDCSQKEVIPVTGCVINPLCVIYTPENLHIEPNCAADCPDCQREDGSELAAGKPNDNLPKKQVDWKRITDSMATPKWLFDGRCIIEIKKMSQLGIRVESIGSAGDNY